MRESRMLGSVRGALSNGCSYRDPRDPRGIGMQTPLSGSHLGPHTRPLCPCNKAVFREAVTTVRLKVLKNQLVSAAVEFVCGLTARQGA